VGNSTRCVPLQGVANRDIKLENTLLRDVGKRPLVKLADFGFSKDENCHSAPGSCVGTPAYLAPEVLSTQKGQSYNAKASMGGIMLGQGRRDDVGIMRGQGWGHHAGPGPQG
jgi:serine/threonine protein kinase